MTDELRDDRARARPGLDGLLGAVLVQLRDLLVELLVYVRSLLGASAHCFSICNLRFAICNSVQSQIANCKSAISTHSPFAAAAGTCRTCGGGGSACRCASAGAA